MTTGRDWRGFERETHDALSRTARRREHERLVRAVAALAVMVLVAAFLAMVVIGVRIGTT
jgi:hypothetical protein